MVMWLLGPQLGLAGWLAGWGQVGIFRSALDQLIITRPAVQLGLITGGILNILWIIMTSRCPATNNGLFVNTKHNL